MLISLKTFTLNWILHALIFAISILKKKILMVKSYMELIMTLNFQSYETIYMVTRIDKLETKKEKLLKDANKLLL